LIYLDTSTKSLQAVYDTNVSTTQGHLVCSYYDVPARTKSDFSDYLGGCHVTTTNNSTHVTACPAPPQNVTRNIESFTWHNGDVTTVALVARVKIDDAGTKKTIWGQTLQTTKTLQYEDGAGWSVL
jgi:hypothetical protein